MEISPTAETVSPEPANGHPQTPPRAWNTGLVIGALGVVFGDIGTSPLYAIRECFAGVRSVSVSTANVFGVISLVFWTIVVVVCIKYVVFLLRADNKGEGGIFALLSLVRADTRCHLSPVYPFLVLAAIFGASLLYGDGVITPAISVLSAMEGLEVATKALSPLVVPLTCVVLLTLFLVQKSGSYGMGRVFGPVMFVWFVTIAALGAKEIVRNPHIFMAVNPLYVIDFFSANKFHGMIVLGSVVLCITGCEDLYLDLGHFGRRAIRISWFSFVFPALLLNYFGQGALLLEHPEAAFNPFYGLVPRMLIYPMVALSTVATVIASQALISGIFSLTQQAVQLGYCPRMRIVHTSPETRGQIYIPVVNYALMVACIGVVLAFKRSSGLAGAYGIAVTATMTITSITYFFVITRVWKWSLWRAVPLVGTFLAFDLAYFSTNLLKFFQGGWFPLAVAVMVMLAMTAWRDGRYQLGNKLMKSRFPIDLFLEDLKFHSLQRVKGAAVFLTVSAEGTPPALLHHVKHNHVLHEKVVLFTIVTADTPSVPTSERLTIEDLGQGFYRLICRYGYMEKPDVPKMMTLASRMGLKTEPATTTFYMGRETLLTSGDSRMMRWRKGLFVFMARNAQSPMAYFGIPPNRVVELGAQIEL
ncbi:MAG TPA: KUP/HAK/KT family potassium transporter [Deltaproteobacteria bacterium]|jgi:KUP system potassium uptake protein|nr:KUP/HAK/KT family potassium transporter [Deltaproteobacteria bacterium]